MGDIDHGRAAASRLGPDRAADSRVCGTDCQAPTGGAAPSVRLAGDRPGDACKSGRIGARTVSYSEGGQGRCWHQRKRARSSTASRSRRGRPTRELAAGSEFVTCLRWFRLLRIYPSCTPRADSRSGNKLPDGIIIRHLTMSDVRDRQLDHDALLLRTVQL